MATSASKETPIGYGSMKRKEDARFIRGQGKYLDDIVLPEMLHGAVLRSPYAHARIVSIDTSAALAHPKVHRVITAKDLETLGLAWMPTISYDSQAVLAGDKVRFQGQEVAFVVAEDRYAARDALPLIDVEYEPLPTVVNARKALDPDAPLIRDDKPGQTDNLASPNWEAGDREEADRVFAEADTVVTRDMIYPRCHPAPLETCGIIADMDPETGQLDIYNGNQAPNLHRTVYAQVAGLPEHMIRIMTNDIGGGFGNKVPVYPGYVCTIVGSIVTGKPVKWVEDRSENLMSTGFARDYLMHGRICAKDGRITGIQVDVIADHGAFDSTAQPSKFPAGFFHVFAGSYDLEAAHCSVKAVYTNKAPGGVAYRCSFRVTEAIYVTERLVGELALKMGVDPVELRMNSFIQPEQFPYENKTGWTYDSGNYPETMREAMRIAGYEELRKEQAEKRARGEPMGIGVSFFTEVVGAGPKKHMDILGQGMADGADLRVHASGDAVLSISAQTQGQGHETTFAQIVGEQLGISPDKIEVRHGDTDRTPFGLGTYGSRSTPVSGASAAVAARRVRDKARLIAAGLLETSPEDLVWEKGRWYVRGDPEKGAMIDEIAAPGGTGGRPRRPVRLRPAQPDLSVRCLHLRRRRRSRHRRDQGAPLHSRRRLWRSNQPDGRRRADHGRPRRGRRDRADGADLFRRAGQLPERVDDGLPDPDRAGVPRLGAGGDGDALPPPPDRRQGRGRVGDQRLAAGDRQRGLRRSI
jgi:aerobic carbon-monoxide dehydrogenase large subunit